MSHPVGSISAATRASAELERRRRVRTRLAEMWRPNADSAESGPNPQRLAMESLAQVVGYGGQAGGGKSDLLLGVAATRHQRSLILRRLGPNLDGLIDRSRQLYGELLTYNEVSKTWRGPGRIIRFRSVQYDKDRENFRGSPYDFYGVDEATEFTEAQIRFITSWNRSADSAQRCRIILTFNPPATEDGEWIIRFFAPWLNPEHPRPARPGELRYFATVDGAEREVDSAESFAHSGETITPQSRTFIRARLADNPYLRDNAAYVAALDALPEPLRSQLKHGAFGRTTDDDPWRVIRAEWVLAAQRRWADRQAPTDAPDALGVDVARGGDNQTAIVRRWGDYMDLVAYPGRITATGQLVAQLVRDRAGIRPKRINVDVIGVGGSAYDHISPMYAHGTAQPVNVAGHSDYRDRSGKLTMRNLRSELYWRLREQLDSAESTLALPPSQRLLADLCSARYTVQAGGVIAVESKEQIRERLGRSPDEGDAVLLSLYEPPKRKVARAW